MTERGVIFPRKCNKLLVGQLITWDVQTIVVWSPAKVEFKIVFYPTGWSEQGVHAAQGCMKKY